MGKRRMIYARLSNSDKWNDLATDQARLLYILILIHTDDMGRMDASPRTVKGICLPSLDWTAQQIETHLADLAKVGLILPYDHEGKQYLQIADFDDYQTFSRERTPQYPEPNFTAVKSSKSPVLQRKGKVREGKVSEGKGSAVDTASGRQLLDYFVLKYKEKYGSDYVPSWRKDVKIFNDLLKASSDARVRQAIDSYFLPNEYTDKRGRDVNGFRAGFNRMPAPPVDPYANIRKA